MPPPELDILRPGARPYRDTGIPKCLSAITLPRPVPSTTEQAPFFQLHPFEFHPPAMTAGTLQQGHFRDPLGPGSTEHSFLRSRKCLSGWVLRPSQQTTP